MRAHVLVLWVLPLLSCVPEPPVKRYVPPAISVPPGCLASFEGSYVHALDPSYRYLASDDGGTLQLRVERYVEDAGVTPRLDRGSPTITLRRTTHGFVGHTRSAAFGANGHRCDVAFPTEVTACADAGLTLRSVSALTIDELCNAASDGGVSTEHRLLRAAPVQLEPPTPPRPAPRVSRAESPPASETRPLADAGL